MIRYSMQQTAIFKTNEFQLDYQNEKKCQQQNNPNGQLYCKQECDGKNQINTISMSEKFQIGCSYTKQMLISR